MKIKLNSILLNANGQEPLAFSISAKRQLQTEFLIAAEHASLFDRGNAKVSASFSIERAHASECDAEIFCAEHQSQIFGEQNAELVFAFEDFSGKTKATFKMQNTQTETIKIDLDGLKTKTVYLFVAPKIERI